MQLLIGRAFAAQIGGSAAKSLARTGFPAARRGKSNAIPSMNASALHKNIP